LTNTNDFGPVSGPDDLDENLAAAFAAAGLEFAAAWEDVRGRLRIP
jgi:hypothetical protein